MPTKPKNPALYYIGKVCPKHPTQGGLRNKRRHQCLGCLSAASAASRRNRKTKTQQTILGNMNLEEGNKDYNLNKIQGKLTGMLEVISAVQRVDTVAGYAGGYQAGLTTMTEWLRSMENAD